MRASHLCPLSFVLSFLLACGGVEVRSNDLLSACRSLFAHRVAYDERCIGALREASDERAYVDSCVGIATAPGSLLAVADITSCIDQLDTPACTGPEIYPACVGHGANLLYPNHEKKGSRQPGEACFAQVQCASGHCSALGDACGVCQRALALGQTCTWGDVCVDAECIDGTCQLAGNRQGESCIDYPGRDCQRTLFCKRVDTSGIDGICTPRGAIGASCDSELPCAADLFCQAGACARRGVEGAICETTEACASGSCVGGKCRRIEHGIGEGGDCSVDRCRPDLGCDETRICRPRAYVPLGGDCKMEGGAAYVCAAGLYCHTACPTDGACSSLGSCVELPGPGAHCTRSAQCAASAVCVGFDSLDMNKGVCVKRGTEGDACPCVGQLACVGGRCVAFSAAVCE